MSVQVLTPDDPTAEHKFMSLEDLRYHYIISKPQGEPVATVLLLHGWYV